MEIKDIQTAVQAEVQPIQEKLDEIKSSGEKNIKKLEESTKELEKNINEIKEKTNVDVTKEVKESIETLKGDVKVIKDNADKNQEFLDKLILERQKNNGPTIPDQPQTFQQSIYKALNEGDNYKWLDMLARGDKERRKRFTIELIKPAEFTKDAGTITTGNVTGSLYGSITRPGIIEPQKRKVHIRDIVPVGTIGPGNTYTFMYEASTGEGEIAPVAEGNAKPQFDMDLVEKTIQVETLAGWVRFTKKAMNNIPGFIAWLQSRLPERLLRVEDDQLVQGDGTSPNISGILDSGNFTAATSTETVLIDQLLDAMAQLEDSLEVTATAGILRPVNYWNFFKNKATGSGEYDLPQNVTFEGGILRISGVPFYATTALPAGKYIVGDFNFGAQLLIQNAMRIEFAEQDADNFTKNLITARIEEDIAFPIYGARYFVAGDVPNES